MTRSFHRHFILVLATDILVVVFSWYSSHLFRLNFAIPQAQFQTLIRLLPLIMGIKILAFLLFDFSPKLFSAINGNLYPKPLYRFQPWAVFGNFVTPQQ